MTERLRSTWDSKKNPADPYDQARTRIASGHQRGGRDVQTPRPGRRTKAPGRGFQGGTRNAHDAGTSDSPARGGFQGLVSHERGHAQRSADGDGKLARLFSLLPERPD